MPLDSLATTTFAPGMTAPGRILHDTRNAAETRLLRVNRSSRSRGTPKHEHLAFFHKDPMISLASWLHRSYKPGYKRAQRTTSRGRSARLQQ